MADFFIARNTSNAKRSDANPFFMDERGERVEIQPGQSMRVSRSVGIDLLNHFARTIRLTAMDEYVKQNKLKTKALVLRSQGIGDIILLTPALRKLATQFDEVHVGVRSDVKCLLDHCPYVARVHTHAIDGSGDAPVTDGTFMLTIDANYWAEKYDPDRAKHHRSLSFAKRLQVELGENERQPDLYCAQEWLDRGEEILPREEGKRYIGIQVRASHSYRDYPTYPHGGQWNPERMQGLAIELAKRGWTVVLLCHFKAMKLKARNVIDLQGVCSLTETIGVINQLDAMVGPDSGLIHVSAALGVPTVGMFGICSPNYRMSWYRGPVKCMTRVPCVGCGDYAMAHCRRPDGKDGACMDWQPSEIADACDAVGPRIHAAQIGESKPELAAIGEKAPSIVIPGASGQNGRGLWMTMMFQDETVEHMQRFADRVIGHSAIEHVVAVDGGCETGAGGVLKRIGKVEVHKIPYCRDYWNAQAHQRNACFSFVRDYQPVFFMDPDEAFSSGMAAWLGEFAHLGIDYGLIARATWNTEDEAAAQGYRSPGTHNWPDWQPRFYRWRQTFKFHGAAHHITLGCPEPTRIQDSVYVLHYEEEAGKRAEREKQWASMMAQKKERVG